MAEITETPDLLAILRGAQDSTAAIRRKPLLDCSEMAALERWLEPLERGLRPLAAAPPVESVSELSPAALGAGNQGEPDDRKVRNIRRAMRCQGKPIRYMKRNGSPTMWSGCGTTQGRFAVRYVPVIG